MKPSQPLWKPQRLADALEHDEAADDGVSAPRSTSGQLITGVDSCA